MNIKDSGERTTFSTGAQRDMHSGKGRMDLLPWAAIIEVGKHCEAGALTGGGAGMSEFPERLRKLRERKRLKRYVLSERCGLNSDAIRRYELGTAKPTMDALKSIADEFGVSVDYLMGRTDYPCVVDIAEK